LPGHKSRALLIECLRLLRTEVERAQAAKNKARAACCWWLLLAVPHLLLRRGVRGGKKSIGAQGVGLSERRFRRFLDGDWELLHAEATAANAQHAERDRRAAEQRAAAAPVDPVEAAVERERRIQLRAFNAAITHLAAGDYRPAMQRLVNTAGVAEGTTQEVADKLRRLHPETESMTDEQCAEITAAIAHFREEWAAAAPDSEAAGGGGPLQRQTGGDGSSGGGGGGGGGGRGGGGAPAAAACRTPPPPASAPFSDRKRASAPATCPARSGNAAACDA
jgi:hypothetical protein